MTIKKGVLDLNMAAIPSYLHAHCVRLGRGLIGVMGWLELNEESFVK